MAKSAKKSAFRGKVASSAKTSSKSSGGSNHLRLPAGVPVLVLEETSKKFSIDILPYRVKQEAIKGHPDRAFISEDGLWYRRPYKRHNNIGPDNKSFVCPASFGKKCPICEAQKALFETDKPAAIKLYPKSRELYVVVPKGSKKHEEIPHVWDMAESLFHNCLRDELEGNEEYEVFPDLEEGFTLDMKIKWKAIGDSKPFPEVSSIDFTEREPYDESILDDVPNLDDCLNVLSYKELEAAFLALDDAEDEEYPKGKGEVEEEEEEERPRNKKTTRPEPAKAAPRKTREPEPDEEEEEEETPPAKAKKPIKSTLQWKDFANNTYKQCKLSVRQYELDIDPADYDEDTLNDFRIAICKALSIEVPKATKGVAEAQAKHERTRRAEPEPEEEEEVEKPKPTWAELEAKTESKLIRYCADNNLDTDPDDYDDDVTSLRKAIAKELGVVVPGAKTAKPAASAAKTAAPAKTNGKPVAGKCPHGFKFGVDTDTKSQCDRCDLWNECIEEKEKA